MVVACVTTTFNLIMTNVCVNVIMKSRMDIKSLVCAFSKLNQDNLLPGYSISLRDSRYIYTYSAYLTHSRIKTVVQ